MITAEGEDRLTTRKTPFFKRASLPVQDVHDKEEENTLRSAPEVQPEDPGPEVADTEVAPA